MSGIKTKEPAWRDEPSLYGPRHPILLFPLWFGIRFGIWAVESWLAWAALAGDYRVRCIDIICPRRTKPSQEEEETA